MLLSTIQRSSFHRAPGVADVRHILCGHLNRIGRVPQNADPVLQFDGLSFEKLGRTVRAARTIPSRVCRAFAIRSSYTALCSRLARSTYSKPNAQDVAKTPLSKNATIVHNLRFGPDFCCGITAASM